MRIKWWTLPPDNPLRVRREFESARSNLQRLRGDADGESQWQIENPNACPSQPEIDRARERYECKRAAWEAAGMPDRNGKRTRERSSSSAAP